MIKRLLVAMVAALGLLGLVLPSAQAGGDGAEYRIYDLGPVATRETPGWWDVFLDVNRREQVVGAQVVNGLLRAVVFQHGTTRDLGSGTAMAISGAGTVAGWSDRKACIFDPLQTFTGDGAYASGISSTGKIVVGTMYGDGTPRMFSLRKAANGEWSASAGHLGWANAVNAKGTIVGRADGLVYIALRDREIIGRIGEGNAVSDSNVVVGQQTFGDEHHGFLFAVDSMTEPRDMGTLPGDDQSTAYDVNRHGVAVGYSGHYEGEEFHTRAVIYDAPKGGYILRDLNELLRPSAKRHWVLEKAMALNDYRMIVGWGRLDGVRHGFVLKPLF